MRFLAVLLLLRAVLSAQNISCALSGTVLDPANAAMAGIQITLTSEDKGFVRTVTTNSNGFFSFPDLTPATFTLAINASGFKTYRQTGIAIGSSEQRSLGEICLQLGELADSVTVNAEAVAVNITTGEKAGSLDAKELDSLALRGRDIFDAVSLMPGVVDTSDGRDAPSPTSIGNIYISGARKLPRVGQLVLPPRGPQRQRLLRQRGGPPENPVPLQYCQLHGRGAGAAAPR